MKIVGLISLLLVASISAGDILAPDVTQGNMDQEQTESVMSEGGTVTGILNSACVSAGDVYFNMDINKMMAVVYLTDRYTIKELPDSMSADITDVTSGQTLIVDSMGMYQDEAWFGVHFETNSGVYEGYIQEEFLAYSDDRMISWREEHVSEREPEVLYGNISADVAQFPSSYQNSLMKLKASHPSWIFVRMDTGLDWKYVIDNEYGTKEPKNLVPKRSADSWKDGGGEVEPGWVRASRYIVEYFMDPRNFLNDKSIFQFEQLTYNPSYHSKEALQLFLNNTFMAGNAPAGSGKYSEIFYDAGSSLGVSPFHLASRVYQEQGAGTSELISGNYPGYEGLYNYFNYGAKGSTKDEIYVNGLKYARDMGWKNPQLSIRGGAALLSSNYILKGQDTLYLQKFNVSTSSPYDLFTHQYMTNLQAPNSEASNIYKLYNQTGSLNSAFVFKIPVYNNMPKHTSSMPVEYVDVAQNFWYYPYVSYAINNGIMVGTDSNHFHPDQKLTRSEMATILYSINGKPSVTYQPVFPDVPGNQWYSQPITWAYQKGIVAGYDNGLFGTYYQIARQELIMMMYRVAQMEGKDMSYDISILQSFRDAGQIAEWAKPAVSWAVKNGVIAGQDGYMNPLNTATRAECATIIYSYLAI